MMVIGDRYYRACSIYQYLIPSTPDIQGWIILCCECVFALNTVGHLAAFLASTHYMWAALLPVATKNIPRHCQMRPGGVCPRLGITAAFRAVFWTWEYSMNTAEFPASWTLYSSRGDK